MKLTITKEWQKLPLASGTLQNSSNWAQIEVSEDTDSDNAGLIIDPGQKWSYSKADVYARCTDNTEAEARLSKLLPAEYDEGGVDDDDIATDADVDTLFNK